MAIQLGCNYSPALMPLIDQGAAQVDWLKLALADIVEEELPAARASRPVLLHTLPRAGAGSRPELWASYPWNALARQLATAGSPHIAVHLWIGAEEWDEPVDLNYQDRQQAVAMLERLSAAVRTLQQHVAVPVLVENVPFLPAWSALRLVVQPEAIWQVVEETGAGLLLDMSHLRCSAHNLGVDVRAYARALPLQAVREVHVSGPRLLEDGYLMDQHLELQAEDYSLLEWLLGEAQPAIVTLEYTAEAGWPPAERPAAALERQLQALRRLI